MTKREKLELGQFQDRIDFGPEYSLVQDFQYIERFAQTHGFKGNDLSNLMVLWSYDEKGENMAPREIWGTRYTTPWMWAEFELLWMEEG